MDIIAFLFASIWTLFVRVVSFLNVIAYVLFALVVSVLYTVELAPHAFVFALAFGAVCTTVHMAYEFVCLARELRAYERARVSGSQYRMVVTAKQLAYRFQAMQDNYLTPDMDRTVKNQYNDLHQVIRNNQ
jgi:hypothetical protein